MPKTDGTQELLRQIVEELKAIKDVLLKPITSQVIPPPATLGAPPLQPAIEKPRPQILPATPIQRQIVNEILNKDFGIEVEPMDGSKYNFKIIVPEKFSAIPPSQRGPKVRDLRPKVLHYNDGDTAIKDELAKIYRTFTPDVQALIAIER